MSNTDPDFLYETLKKYDRQELERIKIAQEISTHHERLTLEKRKLRNENTRLYVIALLTATISLGSAYILKVVDQGFEEKNDFRDKIAGLEKEFRSAADNSKRMEAACDLGNLNNKFNDAEFTAIIKDYKQKCEELATLLVQERQNLSNISQVDSAAPAVKDLGNRVSDLEKREAELMAQLVSVKDKEEKKAIENEIADVTTGIQNVIDEAPADYKSAMNATAQLQQNTTQQIQILTTETGDRLLDKGKVLWFKEGYYVIYDQVRILLQDLDKSSGTIAIQVCEVGEGGACGRQILDMYTLKRYGTVKVQTNSGWYEITFEDIGKAGRNPLTPAAFILVRRIHA